jgi:hypothetical protein
VGSCESPFSAELSGNSGSITRCLIRQYEELRTVTGIEGRGRRKLPQLENYCDNSRSIPFTLKRWDRRITVDPSG